MSISIIMSLYISLYISVLFLYVAITFQVAKNVALFAHQPTHCSLTMISVTDLPPPPHAHPPVSIQHKTVKEKCLFSIIEPTEWSTSGENICAHSQKAVSAHL